ncbi:CBS domain-containing protein [Lyngbya confervoides]|uniref:CBS domain-containing protein n=1 Tax=Lyngbya confervoides BDU141951 TaxID=1574623 RepID=A0ABD4T7R9_9CYAN|nr:CBS domain-containing protein [Lyngbya confervoides]MCM1984819.1 CBS domain-containing protein [Lyngbya confervoides BDU141951]
MSSQPDLTWAPNLQDAIDRQPLILPPHAPLTEAIARISQAHHNRCCLRGSDPVEDFQPSCTSCVLIVQNHQIQGIITERDIVRLTAEARDLQSTLVSQVMIQPVVTLAKDTLQDIFAALFLLRRYRIRHLPILEAQGKLYGVMTHESIRKVLRPANLLQSRRVADVMTPQVIHASLHTSAFQLAWLMAEHHVSCVVITTPDGQGNPKPVGIVTERDIVQFQALGLNLLKTQAAQVMSTPLFLLSPEDSLWKAHQEMQRRHVGRLVVSWNWGQGLGIITQTSLLRVFDPMELYGVIENLQQTLHQLQQEQLASRGKNPPMDMAPAYPAISNNTAPPTQKSALSTGGHRSPPELQIIHRALNALAQNQHLQAKDLKQLHQAQAAVAALDSRLGRNR